MQKNFWLKVNACKSSSFALIDVELVLLSVLIDLCLVKRLIFGASDACHRCIAAMGGDLESMHSRRPNSGATTLPDGCFCGSGQEKGSLLGSSGAPTTLPPSLWLTSRVWSQPSRTIRTIRDLLAGNGVWGFSLC